LEVGEHVLNSPQAIGSPLDRLPDRRGWLR
jgi:hypothetical protein